MSLEKRPTSLFRYVDEEQSFNKLISQTNLINLNPLGCVKNRIQIGWFGTVKRFFAINIQQFWLDWHFKAVDTSESFMLLKHVASALSNHRVNFHTLNAMRGAILL